MTAVTRMRSGLAAAAASLCMLVVAAPAGAATTSAGLYVSGAGYGHGIGMSQYGAAGYALHGATYRQILRDYYAQTTIGYVNPNRRVTVLLKPRGAAAFSGATRISGSSRQLNANARYSVLVVRGMLRIVSGGRTVGTFKAPLQVSGPGPLTLIGQGSYRGAFVFRPSTTGSGVMTINSVGLDSYVRGVVSAEMPAGWPQQALDAQAVAARTYAISAGPIGPDFEVYDDSRSQMYEGIKAETPSTNAAVAATRGQVVEYDGAPAVTYFFASSGGETESVQNVWAGVAPEAWLVGEPDPYDDSLKNPYYRWNMSFNLGAVKSKLGKLVHGSLEGINVLDHGVSPRIVEAQIVGSKGATTISGAQLQADLHAPSTWMSFTTVSAQGTQTTSATVPATVPSAPAAPTSTTSTPVPTTTTSTPVPTTTTTATTTTTPSTPAPSGGVPLVAAGPSALLLGHILSSFSYAVSGKVFPVSSGASVTIQYYAGSSWTTVGTGPVTDDGSYSVPVLGPGIYRVLYNGIIGPRVTVG